MVIRNLFHDLPLDETREVFTPLLQARGFHLERIVSSGQVTPPGEWYDQKDREWVIVLRGRAGLLFHGESTVRVLEAGDYVDIPAHVLHRVEWTDKTQNTVWLALHYSG